MKTEKNLYISLIILLNIFGVAFMDTISEDVCEPEDDAVAQWFTEVGNFVKHNQNSTQHIMALHEKIRLMENNMEKIQKRVPAIQDIELENQKILQDIQNNVLENQKSIQETQKSIQETQKSIQEMIKSVLSIQNSVQAIQKSELENKQSIQDTQKLVQQNHNHLEDYVNESSPIVIQRRMDGSEDFYRTWSEYKKGFGKASGDFFIGLDKLNELTTSERYELTINLEDFENNRHYAIYDNFVIGSEAEKYKLKSLGKYSGTTGDHLNGHVGNKFCTKDQDNDNDQDTNCAQLRHGAWWYDGCYYMNPNGQYVNNVNKVTPETIHWYINSSVFPVKSIEMIIRKQKNAKRSLKEIRKQVQEIQQTVQLLYNYSKQPNQILVQRRMDGSEDFYRTWSEYKKGFGKTTGEFFIGLDKLHELTTSERYELTITVEDFENNRRHATYDNFVIGSEAEKYELKSLGSYTGTAGDSLTPDLGMKFTTKDQDNDNNQNRNCAVVRHGGGWYKNCSDSNLNGMYSYSTNEESYKFIYWVKFKGYAPLKFVEISLNQVK